MPKYKRAQVGETVTWIVATLIILFTLLVSVYAASVMPGAVKVIKSSDLETFLRDQNANGLIKESLFAYLLTKNSGGKTIYSQINSDGKISGPESELSSAIFSGVNYPSQVSVKLVKTSQANGVLDSVGIDKQYSVAATENGGSVKATV